MNKDERKSEFCIRERISSLAKVGSQGCLPSPFWEAFFPGMGGRPQVKGRRLGSRPKFMFHWMSDLKAGHLSSPRLCFLTYKVDTTVPTSLDCCEVRKKEQSKNTL